jgi:hypothetical protein
MGVREYWLAYKRVFRPARAAKEDDKSKPIQFDVGRHFLSSRTDVQQELNRYDIFARCPEDCSYGN